MTLRARSAKANRETFTRRAAEDRAELERVERDPDLTDAGRAARARPIRERMSDRFTAEVARTRTLVDAARAEYKKHSPRAAQLRAALKSSAHAAAVKGLALGASAKQLQELAAAAAETQDLAAAFAVRLALSTAIAGGMEDKETAIVTAALDRVALPEQKAALADYVAARIELDQLIAGGEVGDVTARALRDPAGALNASREAASFETEDGEVRRLSETEVEELRQLAGTLEKAG